MLHAFVALNFIKEQINKICFAMQQRGDEWGFRNEQPPEICLAAMQTTSPGLQFVKEQIPEICLAAVRQYGRELETSAQQDERVLETSVQQDERALESVKE